MGDLPPSHPKKLNFQTTNVQRSMNKSKEKTIINFSAIKYFHTEMKVNVILLLKKGLLSLIIHVEIFAKCLYDAKNVTCGSMKTVRSYFDMAECETNDTIMNKCE